MDKQPARETSLSTNAPILPPPVPPATSESALEAEFRTRIEDIERQRIEENAETSDLLHLLVKQHKRRVQSLVDQHAECIEELSRRLPAVARARPWAKPCLGVRKWGTFSQNGLDIKYGPSIRIGSSSPTSDEAERETVTARKLPTPTITTKPKDPRSRSLSSSSPPSSLPPSPLSSVLSEPISKPAPDTSETRARKHPKRPPSSPDELAFGSSAFPPLAVRKNTKGSRTSQQERRCKPLPSHVRKKHFAQSTQPTQSSSTPPQKPSPMLPASLPVSKAGRQPACLECRRRKTACSRGKPRCLRCERDGRMCRY